MLEHLAGEQQRIEAERAASEERLRFLVEVSDVLSSTLDYEITLERLAQLAVPRLADWCAVDILMPDGSLSRLAIAHADPEKVRWAHEVYQRYPYDAEAPGSVRDVLQSGEPAYYPEITDEMLAAATDDPELLAVEREIGFRSIIIAPLNARGRSLGLLTLVWAESGKRYSEADLQFARELARRAALAVDNARLYAAEQQARREAEVARQRQAFLVDLSAALSASLDYEQTLASVANLAVPRFADWCIVHILSEGDTLQQIALAHEDPAKSASIRDAYLRHYPTHPPQHPIAQVLRTGETVLSAVMTEQDWPAISSDAEHLELITTIAPRSAIVAPLIARGRPLGAVSFIQSQSGRRYTEDDRVLAREIVQRAAVAVDNARLYQEAGQLATRATARAEASRVIADAGFDQEAIFAGILRIAGEQIGDIVTIRLLSTDREWLEAVASRHDDLSQQQALDELLARTPVHVSEGLCGRVFTTGEAIRIPGTASTVSDAVEAKFVGNYERLDTGSLLMVPLRAGGRPIGVLAMIRTREHCSYSRDDLAFAQDLADIAGLAIQNARLYQQARIHATRGAARAEAARVIAVAQLNQGAILASITNTIANLFGDAVVIRLISEDGEWLPPVAVDHPHPEARRFLQAMLEETPLRVGEGINAQVLATRQALHISAGHEQEVLTRTKPEYSRFHLHFGAEGNHVLIVPMQVAGRIIGTFNIFRPGTRPDYTDEDRDFVQDIADRAALAIENARLLESTLAAEEQSRRHAARAEALAEAARDFAEASLDLSSVLETVARRIAETVGDGCLIRLQSEEGHLLAPSAVYHPEPETLPLIRGEVESADYSKLDEVHRQALELGRPVVITNPDVDPDTPIVPPERRTAADRSPARYMLVVPLLSQAQTTGTLVLWRDRVAAPFSDDEQAFAQELADRAALAIENARLYQESQAAVREREAFLSTASHELRTPLTTVKGYGQLLLRFLRQPTLDRDHLTALATHLQDQIGRFETLVGDLLDVSRIQQGRLALRRQPTNLAELAVDVLGRFEQSPERTPDHWLVLDADEVSGLWDPARLDQVLTNLVSNALKYSPAGGEVRVTVRDRVDEGERVAEISVEDHGIGISVEDRRHLFEPFIRGSQARHQIGGTGLGLFIAHQIVEQHGGRLTFESTLGVGTTFTVRLPLRPPEGDDTPPVRTDAPTLTDA